MLLAFITALMAAQSNSSELLVKSDTAATVEINTQLPDTSIGNRAPDTSWVDLSSTPNAPKTIDMGKPVGEYFLYWSTVYTLYIATDGVAVIEPPMGYSFQTVFNGNGDIFPVQYDKNRITIKKKAFDDVTTNLVLLMSSPSGDLNSVTVVVKGGKTTSAINRFIVPTNRATNRVVEQVRSKYLDQMNNRLQSQDETLTKSVWENAIGELDVFRIPYDLDETEEDWKGASYRIDAVVNSRDEGFIYTSTDARDRECQVVDLVSVESSNGVMKKRVELFKVKSQGKRTQLIYRTSRMSAGKWKFRIKIWSRDFTIKTTLQLGDK